MTGNLNTTFGHRPIYICGEAATFTPHSSFLIWVELSSQTKEQRAPRLTLNPKLFSKNVGLSNICYTVLDEIMECIFWRFPSKRSHWEAVIISIIISFELYSEIFKREETMRGIKAFVILAMTAFYFPIVSWGIGTNLFVLDA